MPDSSGVANRTDERPKPSGMTSTAACFSPFSAAETARSVVRRRGRYPLSAIISAAGSLRTPLLGTAMRSTSGDSYRADGPPAGTRRELASGGEQEGPFSEVSVDVVEGQTPGQ